MNVSLFASRDKMRTDLPSELRMRFVRTEPAFLPCAFGRFRSATIILPMAPSLVSNLPQYKTL